MTQPEGKVAASNWGLALAESGPVQAPGPDQRK